MECVLCNELGGQVIYQTQLFRVVLVDDAAYPGFVRLIVNPHVKEMTDLSHTDSLLVFSAVLKIEGVLKKLYHPDKINLASLGNVVPHMHWHIIPRFNSDRHYPNPIWGEVTHPHYTPNIKLCQLESELITQLQHTLAN